MELSADFKRIILKFCFVILGFCIVLWFSVFSYGLLYYLYIPAVAHVKPIHLKYDVTCSNGEKCAFPYDNITLVEKHHYELLSRGQAYAIELVLDMPETERNIEQGMFMVRLDMLSQRGEVLKSSKRPAILRYKSRLFTVMYTLFFAPALLAGTTEEKQSLSIPLFEKYEESCYKPTYFAYVEIQARFAEIYSCSLRIHAQFTGLRYMMYYWPILSAVIGIGSNFFFVSIMIIFIWVRQIMNTGQYINMAELTEREKGLVHEIRQSMQKRQDQGSQGPPLGERTVQRRQTNLSDVDDEIEEVSAYRGAPERRKLRRDPDMDLEIEDPSTKSDDEYSFCENGFSNQENVEQDSNETDTASNLNQASTSTCDTSPALRRRVIA